MIEIRYNGTIKEWYECKKDITPRLFFSISYLNGIKHGPMKEWYQSGVIKYEFFFKNGKFSGVQKAYYDKNTWWAFPVEEGSLKFELFYNDKGKYLKANCYNISGLLIE